MNNDPLVQMEGRLPIHAPHVLIRFTRSTVAGVKEWAGWALMIGVFVGALVLFVRAAIREQDEKEAHRLAWMAECRQDRKNYECEAMWRAGERRDTTTVVPVPMVISR